MDMIKLMERLLLDIQRWPPSVLVEADYFCVAHMRELNEDSEAYSWWNYLRQAITYELEKRGGTHE